VALLFRRLRAFHLASAVRRRVLRCGSPIHRARHLTGVPRAGAQAFDKKRNSSPFYQHRAIPPLGFVLLGTFAFLACLPVLLTAQFIIQSLIHTRTLQAFL